jgi:hypothetical protein
MLSGVARYDNVDCGRAVRYHLAVRWQSFPRVSPAHTQDEHDKGNVVGLDVATGEPCQPEMAGVYDNYIVKKQVGWHGTVFRWPCKPDVVAEVINNLTEDNVRHIGLEHACCARCVRCPLQILQSAPVVTSQLLLVDEVMRAGINMRGK